MFSWSIFWVACVCLGIVGASAKSAPINNVFQLLVLLCSFALIIFGLKVSLVPLSILIGFAIFSFFLVRSGQSVLWALIPIILIWAIAKFIGYIIIPSLPLVAFVGLSYFVVKLFTFLRDYQSGLIKSPNFLTTLNYLFFAPTFWAGPMHYYREFDKTIKAPKLPGAEEMIPLAFRILWGATKVFILVPFLAPKGLPLPVGEPDTALALILRSFVFTFQLYFEFSGYSDMAIGAAKLMGIYVPENFNRPLQSRNVVEFWQRWHITFMRVITGYIYVPLARSLAAKHHLNSTLVMAIAIFGAFFVSGFWHGASTNFILWGLYNALLIILYELIKPYLKKLLQNKFFSTKIALLLLRAVSIGLTFFFISLGWILFNMEANAVQQAFGL